ncbi:MAG TPA: hypothetical protein ENI62_11735 [Gammaproteobacteria bacterium]|nr:hypothetical protein [Gammaproteobacteria bacterium]
MSAASRVEQHLLGMTREEFQRLIPKVVGEGTAAATGLCWQLQDGNKLLVIQLGSQGERRLSGLLSLPTLETTFTFADYSESEYAAFMERFWLVFRRGGG